MPPSISFDSRNQITPRWLDVEAQCQAEGLVHLRAAEDFHTGWLLAERQLEVLQAEQVVQ